MGGRVASTDPEFILAPLYASPRVLSKLGRSAKTSGTIAAAVQSRGEDADGASGMIGDHSVRNRRQAAGADDGGVEQREASADVAIGREIGNRAVQHR